MARAFIKSVLLASEDFIRNLFIISVLCSKVGCVCAMHQNKKKKTKIDLHALLNYETKGIKPAFNRLQKATSKPKYVQAKLVLAEKMVRSFYQPRSGRSWVSVGSVDFYFFGLFFLVTSF